MAKRIVILTGTNRGLGKRTAEIFLEKYSAGTHYVFTQRGKDGTELTAALKRINPAASFEIQPLEITDKASRAHFIQWLEANHKTADAIFNNAGFYDKENDNGKQFPSKKVAQNTLDVNFTSTVEFTEEILPFLSSDAKIVQTSSVLGQIAKQPIAVRPLLQDPTLTKERLFQISNDYINSTEDPSKNSLFGKNCYFFSKALLTAYVRFVAQRIIKPNQSIFAVHPGWVQTDMGGKQATLTVDQACPYLADIIGQFPYGRHPLNGKLIFENKQIDY